MDQIYDKVFSELGLAGAVIVVLGYVALRLFRELMKEKDARRRDAVEMLGHYRDLVMETNKTLEGLGDTLTRWLQHSGRG